MSEQKLALVTGASRGIGRAIAERLVQDGFRVVGTATSDSGAEAVRSALQALGAEHDALVLNIADPVQTEAALKDFLARFGTPYVVVNNAGITRDAMLHKMDDDQWDQVIAVNLTGVFYGIQCAGRYMREKKSGKIVNISSTSALGNAGQLNYAATKAGVIGMTKTAAKELGPKNVNVNCIAPGMIWTDMMKSMPPEVLQQMDAMMPYLVPLNRKGSPLDIANLALFLASEESQFITGQVIFCEGGMKM